MLIYKVSAWKFGCNLRTPAHRCISSDTKVGLANIVMACYHTMTSFLYLVLLAMLVALSQEVDIVMTDDMFSVVKCPEIAPGVCCQPPQTRQGFPHITIYHMTFFDIGAIWSSRMSDGQWRGACSGVIVDSERGPGWWNWRAVRGGRRLEDYAHGASYITIPEGLPPATNMISALLVQGILGLAWGGGKCFASPAAEKYLERHSYPMRRNRQSALTGDVLATSPGRTVYPSYMKVDGTEYKADEGAGKLMYRVNGTGALRNLTELFAP